MTMVNTAITNSSNKNAVSLRKTNKPLMEKRRRARINDSLSQLKSLVIHSSKKDSSQFSKLEKADILELTVKHLRGLQAQQQQQQQQLQQHQLSSMPSNNVASDAFVNGKYRAGFAECAGEVIRYLDQAQGLNPETKSKVISHLAGCLQIVSSSTSSSSSLQPQQPQQFSHPHHQQPQLLSKVVSQPINTSTPLPSQQLHSSNNAAAILAAAAAAVNNPNNPASATTQLPNGQIIQVVNNGTSSIQPSAVVSLPQSQNHSVLPNSTHNAAIIMKQTSSIPSVPSTSMPSVTQPAFIHYAQPLHIQIPPIVSPILINKSQSNIQHSSSNHQGHEQRKQFVEQSKDRLKDYPSSLVDQPNQDIVSSSTNPVPVTTTSSLQTKPKQLRQSTSPPSLYPGHPKARAQKQLNFFTQEFNSTDNKYCSRFSKSDLTPSPSSASSSSSESENSSPLNLSQSPPLAVYKLHKRYHPYTNNLEEKCTNSNNFTMGNKSTNLLTDSQNRLPCHNVPSSTHQPMSVIVDSRNKCSDFNTGRYWSLEEDRQCNVRHNTPSPASSVGEERLWRPW